MVDIIFFKNKFDMAGDVNHRCEFSSLTCIISNLKFNGPSFCYNTKTQIMNCQTAEGVILSKRISVAYTVTIMASVLYDITI